MTLYGYTRVSTESQSLARQDLGDVDVLLEEVASGANRDRPTLTLLLDVATTGDTVRVYSIDRLARSLGDLMKIIETFTGNGATVEFVKENLTFTGDTSNPFDVMMLQVMGAAAQFERSILLQRQREGIAKAKEAGKYKGRTVALTADQVALIREQRTAGVPIARLARTHAVSRGTIYAAVAGTGVYA